MLQYKVNGHGAHKDHNYIKYFHLELFNANTLAILEQSVTDLFKSKQNLNMLVFPQLMYRNINLPRPRLVRKYLAIVFVQTRRVKYILAYLDYKISFE